MDQPKRPRVSYGTAHADVRIRLFPSYLDSSSLTTEIRQDIQALIEERPFHARFRNACSQFVRGMGWKP